MIESVVVIGTGNVAKAICPALLQNGIKISQVLSRDQGRTDEFCRQLNDLIGESPSPHDKNRHKVRAISSFEHLDTQADLYLLAVRDDAIRSASDQIAKFLAPDRLIAHLSGAMSPAILNQHFTKRVCIWPLYSFSGQIVQWKTIPVFLTAGPETIVDVKELAGRISDRVHIIEDSDKEKVHVAAVFANNFSNYNLRIAEKILDEAKVPLSVMESITYGMFEKAFNTGPLASQSGPAHRGDSATIEKHLSIINKLYPQYVDLYRIYSEIIRQKK